MPVAAMSQLSALALSEVSAAFTHAGLEDARDMQSLTEVLVLVRTRLRSCSDSGTLQAQQQSLQRCLLPLVQWLIQEPDVANLTQQQKTDLVWNLYTATVSRTVLADKFPMICSSEEVWNSTVSGLFVTGDTMLSMDQQRHWVLRYLDVLLMLMGLVGFCLDRFLLSDRGRVYVVVGSTIVFGLGALLWYHPIFERYPLSVSTPTIASLLPPRVRPSVELQPPAVTPDVPPATAPPLPGLHGGADAFAVHSSSLEALHDGASVILNGAGPTALLSGQRGWVSSRGVDGYGVVLQNGMRLNAVPLEALTMVPQSEQLQAMGGLPQGESAAAAVPSSSNVYVPFAGVSEEKVKQQSARLKQSLEKAYALQSTVASWAVLFWQAVKNEADLVGLAPAVKGALTGHGYVGDSTIGPPRYEELKKQLGELESFAGPQHGSGGALLRNHVELQVSDPEQMAWHLKLPADLQRAGPELYRNIRAEGVGSVRQWVNEQHAGLEAKSSTQFQDLFTAATIIDFELAGCRSESELMAKLATSDTLEIHLRKLGAFIYYRRTKDKTGANRMLGIRAPGSGTDIAPKWMLDDANIHSKTEYQRLERGQKFNRLEQPNYAGGGGRGDGKTKKGGGKGGGRGKPQRKGAPTPQG